MEKSINKKRQRDTKTINGKYDIIVFYEDMIKKGIKQAKTKTKEHFKLPQLSTLNTILKNKCKIKDAYERNETTSKRKRFRDSKYGDVDTELYEDFRKMRDKQAEIRTIDLKTKSLEIAIAKGLPDLKASNGYFRGFYDRYDIQCKSLHGEAGSVDSSTVIEWFTKVNNIIKEYENKDVYNLDETGLFYKAERGKSFVTGKESANSNLRGVKQSKERFTVLVGASMIGEKLPLFVIGKSVNPYCFRNVSSLPAIYRSQPSAWMDQIIFLEYLNKLDKRFETEKRKCIVFIDNCRAHPPQDNLKHMKALEVVFSLQT